MHQSKERHHPLLYVFLRISIERAFQKYGNTIFHRRDRGFVEWTWLPKFVPCSMRLPSPMITRPSVRILLFSVSYIYPWLSGNGAGTVDFICRTPSPSYAQFAPERKKLHSRHQKDYDGQSHFPRVICLFFCPCVVCN